jgi:hypothetical protein
LNFACFFPLSTHDFRIFWLLADFDSVHVFCCIVCLKIVLISFRRYQMLSKVVASAAKFTQKKQDAEVAMTKEKTAFDSSKTAVAVATDEYLSASAKAEKEKEMIYKIRSMVCLPYLCLQSAAERL